MKTLFKACIRTSRALAMAAALGMATATWAEATTAPAFTMPWATSRAPAMRA